MRRRTWWGYNLAFGLAICLFAQFLTSSAAGQAETSPGPPGQSDGEEKKRILDMDIGDLVQTPVTKTLVSSMDTPVTSVAREQSTIGHSAAAVFVITNDMIRRSGVTNIPDALRMAPGLDVANINSNIWAVSARGFNGRYANKLLVMIDGRSVYTPVYSGVNWSAQDVLLEDVDRIEVIRGPGGTLWGANAVNGVINIITKSAKETQGAYVSAGGGTHERLMDAFRYGGQVGEGCTYRVYGKSFERGLGGAPPTNSVPNDASRQGQFGFRVDWDLDRCKTDTVTVQGDIYTGVNGIEQNRTLVDPPAFPLPQFQSIYGHDDASGGNLLARWRHVIDEDSDWTLQSYYDCFGTNNPLSNQKVTTGDVDFQHRFPLTARQEITWGAGFRQFNNTMLARDDFTVHFTPAQRTVNTISQFIQDDITLVEDRLVFTPGIKFEENDYTGFEYQPSMRLLYTPDKQHSLWGAVSRAVRTPARTDADVVATYPAVSNVPMNTFPRFEGNPDLASEALIAYEIGYRAKATERFSYDIATFYNTYDRLRSLAFGTPFVEASPGPPHLILPATMSNGPRADTYGIELASNWQVGERWRLYGQYTFFNLRMYTPSKDGEGVDPHHQFYIRSSWDLGHNVDYDVTLRYVDALTALQVPAYLTMDMRLGWRPRKWLEVAVVGQNLLQTYHQEYGPGPADLFTDFTQVPRGVYGTVTCRF